MRRVTPILAGNNIAAGEVGAQLVDDDDDAWTAKASTDGMMDGPTTKKSRARRPISGRIFRKTRRVIMDVSRFVMELDVSTTQSGSSKHSARIDDQKVHYYLLAEGRIQNEKPRKGRFMLKSIRDLPILVGILRHFLNNQQAKMKVVTN